MQGIWVEECRSNATSQSCNPSTHGARHRGVQPAPDDAQGQVGILEAGLPFPVLPAHPSTVPQTNRMGTVRKVASASTQRCATTRHELPARPGPRRGFSPAPGPPAFLTAESDSFQVLQTAHCAALVRWPGVGHSLSIHWMRSRTLCADSCCGCWRFVFAAADLDTSLLTGPYSGWPGAGSGGGSVK